MIELGNPQMETVKPKDIKPLLFAPLRLIKPDAKEVNTILQSLCPTICKVINDKISDAIRVYHDNNNTSYFDVVGEQMGQSIAGNDAAAFDRSHMRDILIKAIKTASSEELRLKYIVELNKFDDNYQHASKDTPLTIELTQYKVDPDWCKSMCSRGLCIADDTSTG